MAICAAKHISITTYTYNLDTGYFFQTTKTNLNLASKILAVNNLSFLLGRWGACTNQKYIYKKSLFVYHTTKYELFMKITKPVLNCR